MIGRMKLYFVLLMNYLLSLRIGWGDLKRSPKNAELVLRCNNGGFPRYVLNQLKIFVPVGKDMKIVTPVK